MTAATTVRPGWRRFAVSLATKGGIGRSMASVAAASGGAQLLSLAILPIVSRALTPDAFARFGLFFSLAATMSAVGALGMPEAVLAARTRRDAVALTAAALWGILAVGGLCAVVTHGLIDANALGLGALPSWAAAAMAPVVWLICLMMLLQMWSVRARRFETLAAAYVGQGFARAGLQVAVSLAAPALGWLALLAGEFGGRLSAVMLLTRRVGPELRLALRRPFRTWLGAVRRYWRFPVFRTPSMLANNIGSGLPLFLIAAVSHQREVGAFAFMMGVVVGPIGLVQRAVGDVFLGEFAARWRRDPSAAARLLTRTALALTMVAAASLAGLALLGPAVFAFVFGEPWRLAGSLAAAFAPAFAANIIVAPLGGALNVAGRPGFKLFVDLATIGGLLFAFTVGRALGFDAIRQTIAFSAASVGAYAVYFALILFALRRPGGAVRQASDAWRRS